MEIVQNASSCLALKEQKKHNLRGGKGRKKKCFVVTHSSLFKATAQSFDKTAAFVSTCDESSHQLKPRIMPDW